LVSLQRAANMLSSEMDSDDEPGPSRPLARTAAAAATQAPLSKNSRTSMPPAAVYSNDPAIDASPLVQHASKSDASSNWGSGRPIPLLMFGEDDETREESPQQPPLLSVQNNQSGSRRGRPSADGKRARTVAPGVPKRQFTSPLNVRKNDGTREEPPQQIPPFLVQNNQSRRGRGRPRADQPRVLRSQTLVHEIHERQITRPLIVPTLSAIGYARFAAARTVIVKTLTNARRKTEWKPAVSEEEPVDSHDEKIDQFILENDGKDGAWWDALTDRMTAKKQEFSFDYIITCEPNLTPETLAKNPKNAVLIKWTDFAIPTWTCVKDVNKKRGNSDQVIMMMNRLKIHGHLEKRCKEKLENGQDFHQIYKHRWLDRVDDIGDYVTDPRAKYLNRALAFEWRINYEYKKAYEAMGVPPPPPIYVMNWVDDAPVPGMDMPLKFITRNQPSAKVAAVLANTNEMEWVKCSACTLTCSVPKEHWHRMTPCCGVLYGARMHYDASKLNSRVAEPEHEENMMKEIVVDLEKPGKDTRLTSNEIEASIVVECVEACMCNGSVAKDRMNVKEGEKEKKNDEEKRGGKAAKVAKIDTQKGKKKTDKAKPARKPAKLNCRQMVVQRGRQVSLVIFRELGAKGWGLRAGELIDRNQFVTEYVGEVQTASEQEEHHVGSHYSFGMRFGWGENVYASDRVRNLPKRRRNTKAIRKHRPFSIEATNMGNESRFINHSCEPNLVAAVVYVERNGEFYHRVAFFARRTILPGEELTFDYFPGKDDIKMWKSMFDECQCKTESCKFKDFGSDTEDDKDDADSVYSVDSFMSDNEEYLREVEIKRKEKKKRRREKRKERKENGEAVEEKKKEKKKSFAVNDMKRDPLDILTERFGGDRKKAEQTMQSRQLKGVLGLFMTKPFNAEAQKVMLDEAREIINRRRKEEIEEKKRKKKKEENEEKERKEKEEEMKMVKEEKENDDAMMEVQHRAPKRKSSVLE
ncbi:hypothetical protein PENTCL1PPCAC_25200, partial [Pristionchus entomophagus]